MPWPGRLSTDQTFTVSSDQTWIEIQNSTHQRVPAPSCHITRDWHERESSRSLMMCLIKSPTFILNQKLMLRAYQNRRRKLFSAKLLFSVQGVMRKKSLCCFRCLDCNATHPPAFCMLPSNLQKSRNFLSCDGYQCQDIPRFQKLWTKLMMLNTAFHVSRALSALVHLRFSSLAGLEKKRCSFDKASPK